MPRQKDSGAHKGSEREPSAHARRSQPRNPQAVRAIPLGGVGEVGKNATVIECGNDLVLVDAGVKFPEEEQRGIDLVIPDVTYVREHIGQFRGIILTHGHEDHIGALPYLLPQLSVDGRRVPLYGSRLTLGMVQAKLRERRALDYAEMHPVEPGDSAALGGITSEFLSVSHSIPGSFMAALHTSAGIVIMTGDFRFDSTPDSANVTDRERMKELGRQGVLALLTDCVRIERPGRTPPETLVFEAIARLIEHAEGRVIITTFASNIPRLEHAIISANELGRKTAVAGRSMEQNLVVAAELGYIHLPKGSVIPVEEANHLPDNQVVLLTTGSQGEPTSALARIASGVHPTIHLKPGDTVVLSAEPVPGNTETVARTIDNLFRHGARVIYSAMEPHIHVSGHSSRDELRDTLRTLRPRYVAPVHGEYRHQWLYGLMAREEGYEPDRVFITELGDVIEFSRDAAGWIDRVPAGAVLVDGLTVGDVSGEVLRDRLHLAADGVMVVTIVVDRDTGELLADPEVVGRGVVNSDAEGFIAGGVEQLRRSLKRASRGRPEYGEMVERVKDVLGTYIWKETRLRPLIIPTIVEI
jgi:ribonuclease J